MSESDQIQLQGPIGKTISEVNSAGRCGIVFRFTDGSGVKLTGSDIWGEVGDTAAHELGELIVETLDTEVRPDGQRFSMATHIAFISETGTKLIETLQSPQLYETRDDWGEQSLELISVLQVWLAETSREIYSRRTGDDQAKI